MPELHTIANPLAPGIIDLAFTNLKHLHRRYAELTDRLNADQSADNDRAWVAAHHRYFGAFDMLATVLGVSRENVSVAFFDWLDDTPAMRGESPHHV